MVKVFNKKLADVNIEKLKIRAKKLNWTESRLNQAIEGYLEFLALCKEYPYEKISPSSDVDEIWHLHILDTKEYAKDCDNYLGAYLHHDPCMGEPDRASIKKTLFLYKEFFGKEPNEKWKVAAETCAAPGEGCGSYPTVD